MLKFLQMIFMGHSHKWKIIQLVDLYCNPTDTMPYAKKYICQCEECGKIRKFKV